MNNFTIRAATAADCSAIGRIAEHTDLFPAAMLDDMIAAYIDQRSSDIWFVCTSQNEVVAFGFCQPERMTEGTWNLLAIGVTPDRQGTGIGARMMAYLEQQLREQGQRILIVETMGTPELQQTREFYRKNGYVKEARIREFYEAGADKIVFWKALSS